MAASYRGGLESVSPSRRAGAMAIGSVDCASETYRPRVHRPGTCRAGEAVRARLTFSSKNGGVYRRAGAWSAISRPTAGIGGRSAGRLPASENPGYLLLRGAVTSSLEV